MGGHASKLFPGTLDALNADSSNSKLGLPALSKTLIEEVLANGLRIDPSKVLGIAKLPNGKIVWIETGKSGEGGSGLTHIIEQHGKQFEARGISADAIPRYLLMALSEGKLVGQQGSRPVYELIYDGKRQRVAITVSKQWIYCGCKSKISTERSHKMKTIRIRLEYNCYPVWIYRDDGLVEDNSLPPELLGDIELNSIFTNLQQRYDATFVDTPTEFANKGFSSTKEKSEFYDDLHRAIEELARKCPKIYSIDN